MRLQAWTHEEYFEMGKAIIRKVTGVVYPFAPKTFQRAITYMAGIFAAQTNVEMVRTVRSGSLDGVGGMLQDRKAMEYDTARETPKAARLVGRFHPIISPATADISILANTLIIRPSTATQSEIVFRTEAAAMIPSGGTESNLVYAVCVDTGERGNYIPDSSTLELQHSVSGVAHFFTEAESAGGVERESNDDLATRARARRRGHGETTWSGIESLLGTVYLSTGNRVTVSKVFEAFDEGLIYAIIDDGSGQSAIIGPQDTTTYRGANYWYYDSTGYDIYVDLPGPVANNGWVASVATLSKWTGAWNPLVHGVDYWVDDDWAKIALVVPLTSGQRLRAQYDFYTGLVGEASKRVNGVRGSESYTGWRPVGVRVRVRAAYTRTVPTVVASLSFLPGWDSTYGRSIAAKAVLSYLNSLPIGSPARYTTVSGILHKTPGVDYVTGLLLNSGTSDVAPTHKYGVVRGSAASITV